MAGSTNPLIAAMVGDAVFYVIAGLLVVAVVIFFSRPRIAEYRVGRARRATLLGRIPEEYRPPSHAPLMACWFLALGAAISFGSVSAAGSLVLMIAVTIVFGAIFVRRVSTHRKYLIASVHRRATTMDRPDAASLVAALEDVYGPDVAPLRESMSTPGRGHRH